MADNSIVDSIYYETIKKYQHGVEEFFAQNEGVFDSGHGFDHAMKVAENCWHAIRAHKHSNPRHAFLPYTIKCMILAALLHDFDDGKFMKTKNYENARKMIEGETDTEKKHIILMISLVSCSSNGNNIDSKYPIWMYYPRFADRLESLGRRGVEECKTYSDYIGRPYFLPETAQVTNMEELKAVATPERFRAYVEKRKTSPDTMIDHYYDKTVHLAVKTGNKWLDRRFEEEMKFTLDVLFYFGRTGLLFFCYATLRCSSLVQGFALNVAPRGRLYKRPYLTY